MSIIAVEYTFGHFPSFQKTKTSENQILLNRLKTELNSWFEFCSRQLVTWPKFPLKTFTLSSHPDGLVNIHKKKYSSQNHSFGVKGMSRLQKILNL